MTKGSIAPFFSRLRSSVHFISETLKFVAILATLQQVSCHWPSPLLSGAECLTSTTNITTRSLAIFEWPRFEHGETNKIQESDGILPNWKRGGSLYCVTLPWRLVAFSSLLACDIEGNFRGADSFNKRTLAVIAFIMKCLVDPSTESPTSK